MKAYPKILLITPTSDNSRKTQFLIPSGLLAIAGYLRKNSMMAQVYNASLYNKEQLGQLKKTLTAFKPDIIGIGFPTDAFQSAIDIAKTVKEVNKQVTIIVGGIHPTAMPEQTLGVPFFDYLVLGEGEITLLELIRAITNKNDLVNVKGIGYRWNGKIIVTELRPEIINLDEIPFDNRDLLIDIRKYPKEVLGQIHTSRGCSYSCVYCSTPIIWKRKVRFRSVENVLAEVEYLYTDYNVRDINFTDDNFTLESQRVYTICKGILNKGLKINWRCCARADIHKQFDLELLKLMKRSGCKSLCIGFESGSQVILDNAERQINLSDTASLIKMIKGAGIKLHADFIVGLPGENKSTLNQTFQMMKHIWNKTHATMSVVIFKSYPGTAAYEQKELPDYKELHSQFSEIFNYAETCNIKNLSGNVGFLKNRIKEAISSPKELKSLFVKTIKAWTS
jgi:anaerobic magnesium-protoporphyrin IX monomethyl ester cyclase